jgi:methenyltetrahydromethanopterin cyclohydrolase
MDIRPTQCLSGASIYDFGVEHFGTVGGGLLLARICLGGLAGVDVCNSHLANFPYTSIQVQTDHPVTACIASQYAGWPVAVGKFFAMGSGPARLLRGREPMLEQLKLTESSEVGVVILESANLPGRTVVDSIAAECGLTAKQLHICVARTSSLAGMIQIVARSIETTLHKLFEIGFDLNSIRSGMGWAPLPPVAPDDLTALGWTNDAILYGAKAFLIVESTDKSLRDLQGRLTSDASHDFGRPFLEIFNEYNRDFYQIDKLLFSPAAVTINNANSGNTFSYGQLHEPIMNKSFRFGENAAEKLGEQP